MTRIFGILPAAGSGTRMKTEVPKVLLPIHGEPAVARALRLLTGHVRFDGAVVAASDTVAIEAALKSVAVPHLVVKGGAQRQDSVKIALDALSAEYSPAPEDLVVVHDAARCFVSPDLVQRCVEAASRSGAVTAAVPVPDSLVRVDAEGVATEWIDRSGVWAVQTPQVFRFDLIARAHREAAGGATDDASLVAAFHPVAVVEGARENIKLTTPADFTFAMEFLV